MSEEKPKGPSDCMIACMTVRACDASSKSKAIACLCARQYDRDRIRICIRENCSIPESATFYDWCAWEIRYLPPELLESSTAIPITTTRDVSSTAPGTTITPNQDTATSPDSSVTLPSITDATESLSRLSSVAILDFTSPISTFTTSTTVPALAGTINRSRSSSTSTLATAVPENVNSQGRVLSNGAKAGIGFGAAFGVVALLGIACVLFWRRRRRNENRAQKTTLIMLPHDQNDHYDGVKKAELPAKSVVVDDRTWVKPELPGNENKAVIFQMNAALMDSEHHGQWQSEEWHEADGHETHELDPAVTSPHSIQRTEASLHHWQSSTKPSSGLSSTLAGPIPAASDLYPPPQGPKDDQEETDLEYQGRRLEERRAMIAERERLALEKEQLAMEEEALRRRRVSRAGTKSGR